MPNTKQDQLVHFLPAALAVQKRPPNPASHVTAGTIIALLLSLAAWSYWGEIDIVARAEGKIIPLGQVRPVQSAEAGVVREILVAEGDDVEEGATLLRLDPSLINTEIERADIELQRLKRVQQRERELLNLIDLNEQGELIPNTDDIQLLQSFSAYQQRLIQMRRLISEREAARDSANQTLERLLALEPVVRERVDALTKLQAHKHASRLELLAQEERLIDLQHQAKAASFQRDQTESEIAARQSELAAFIGESRVQKLALIEEHQSAIESQQQVMQSLRERAFQHAVLAPVSGRVKDLSVFAPGAVIGASEQIMSIVPLEENLEVEAWLANRDIGFINTGDPSEIKLETFPFTKYGVLHGEVIDLSADATQTETGLTYKVRIAMNSREIEVDNRIVSLLPGMGVTAEIHTGKRRVIDYVFDPLMRYRNESLRER